MPVDEMKELALESDCLRRFFEDANGTQWLNISGRPKLLQQLRKPDGTPLE